MSKEVKLGLLALVAAIVGIWGFKFIKGQDIFQKSTSYYTTYDDVTGLASSSLVYINGLKVGAVSSIVLNPDNVSKMDVHFNVDGDFIIPKEAKIIQKPESMVGGKILSIEFNKPCDGDCATNGTFFEGINLGLIGSMVSTNEISSYAGAVGGELQNVISGLGAEGQQGALNESIRSLEKTLSNISELTFNMNKLIQQSYSNLNASLVNVNKITAGLAQNSENIDGLIKNMETVSGNFANLQLDSTVLKTNAIADEALETVKSLTGTLEAADKTLASFKVIAEKINDKDGNFNKLMSDDELYDNIENATKQVGLLLQDVRLNPKRYVNISVFGKKQKYVLPAEDPAVEMEE